MKFLQVLVVLLCCAARVPAQHSFLTEGHRGCRGLMPENTVAAMKKAMDLGVDVLEIDVVISKDSQVVVSHDPYMDADFCLKPDGSQITKSEEKKLLLFQMPYSVIRQFDAGSKQHPQFPEQQNFKTYKPLLAELIDSVEVYARERSIKAPLYNIEIKSDAKTDGTHQPEPATFVKLVLDVCRSRDIVRRMNIQSFDVRPLRIIHQQDSTIILAYLVANLKSIDSNLVDLGFQPHIFSPHYKMVDPGMVRRCHELGMQIIPWTINDNDNFRRMKRMGVDGIITDFPPEGKVKGER